MLTQILMVKAMVFPSVMYRCKSCAIKKAECWRTDGFKLQFWRRLLRVSRTARRWNQSILKEINPEYSSEGGLLEVKLQYFGHLMWRAYTMEKNVMLGKTEVKEGDMQQKMRWLDSITTQWTWIWANSGRQRRTEEPAKEFLRGLQRVRYDLVT